MLGLERLSEIDEARTTPTNGRKPGLKRKSDVNKSGSWRLSE
jgi:hypothetical protein